MDASALCIEACKHNREAGRGRDAEMTRCCICMRWYHLSCFDGSETTAPKKQSAAIWNCPSCRILPSLISDLIGEVRSMKSEMQTLVDECRELKQENKRLQDSINALQPKEESSQDNSETHQQKTLVIGDSLLRDFNAANLIKTTVISKSGAKLNDILEEMEQQESYDRVVCCVGTNDCGRNSFSSDTFASKAEELITMAKTKVSEPSAVTVSSIPPRLDKTELQENVDLANACLASLAAQTDVTFLNNDASFKLSDGTINDGYLLKDGLHLSRQGSRRLASNMTLTMKSGTTDITNGRPPQHGRGGQRGQDDGGWNTAQHRRHGGRNQPQHSSHYTRGCYNCGEKNHTTERCRHGRPIVCTNCQRTGHKAKYCRRA